MGSIEGAGGGQRSTATIYDLSIREIDLIMKKLEADNMNLRRELHESRVKLNDKDEEILRLSRELLSQKKETLFLTRRIISLSEDFKMGQVQAINNFLLNLFENNKSQEQWNSVDCSLPHASLAISGAENSVMKVPTLKGSGNVEDDASTVTCSEDDEQHVKAPLSYQYRHLRLQLNPNAGNNHDGKQFFFQDPNAGIGGTDYYDPVA